MWVGVLGGVGGILGAIAAIITILFTRRKIEAEGEKIEAEAGQIAVNQAQGVLSMQQSLVAEQRVEIDRLKFDLGTTQERLDEMTHRWAKEVDASRRQQRKIDMLEGRVDNLRRQLIDVREHVRNFSDPKDEPPEDPGPHS